MSTPIDHQRRRWRATMRERRTAARLEGVCGVCTIRDARPGKKTCGVCGDRRGAPKRQAGA
jgi:hypothetical protein